MNKYTDGPNSNPFPQQPEHSQYAQPSQHLQYPQTGQSAPSYPAYSQPLPYQQPYQPPVQPSTPPRRGFSFKSFLKYAAVALIFFFIGMGIGQANAKQPTTDTTTTSVAVTAPAAQAATVVPTKPPTPQPTAKPTQAPKWTTTHTFTGSGIKKTSVFTVPDDWKITWSCTPSSFYGSYNVIVAVYNSDGTMADIAVNTMCKAGNTGDMTEEHQGGDVYLDVNSEGDWNIQVQELK